MVNKIIYVGYLPLTKKVSKDFFINEAIQNNYISEYWDLSHLIFPDIFNEEKTNQSFECIFKNFDQVKNRIQSLDLDKSIFIINFTYGFNVVKIFLLLEQYNCKKVFFARGALPVNKFDTYHFIDRFISYATNPKNLLDFLKNKVAQIIIKIGLVKPYSLVFNAGLMGTSTIGYNFKNRTSSNFVNINSFDFDDFQRNKLSSRLVNEKYCVFHDEYLPLHPDFSILGINTVSPDLYYKELNDFFDLIEQTFKVKVVIAAHPKAEKYKSIDMFNKRNLFFNKINPLIKFSEFSILHGSSSVSYSILNKKPCIFITSNSIKTNMPTYDKIIKSFSNILGQLSININTVKGSDLSLIPVNNLKYDSYKYNYLTSKESENQNSKEIFFQKILTFE